MLDVALDMHADGTWERARMRQIASAASVSRQTLYNMFGDRAGITRALLERETERLLDGVDLRWHQVCGRGADTGDCLAAALSWMLAASQSHPLLRDQLTGHGHAAAGANGRGLTATATELCRRLTDVTGPGGQPDGPDQRRAVEAVVRITLSYLLLPAGSHQQARSQIAYTARNLLPSTRPPRRTPTVGPTGGRAGDRIPPI